MEMNGNPSKSDVFSSSAGGRPSGDEVRCCAEAPLDATTLVERSGMATWARGWVPVTVVRSSFLRKETCSE